MKECEILEIYGADGRKARVERQNRFIRKNFTTPEPSFPGSSLLSHDFSLRSPSVGSGSRIPTDPAPPRRPSRVLHGCPVYELSPKDQKILELMALRRESRMEEREMAFLARTIWEAQRVERARKTERNKEIWVESLSKKKEMEELENAIRRNNLEDNFEQEKMILKLNILKKHERVGRRLKELYHQRKSKPEEMTTKYQLALRQELKKQKQEEEEVEKAVHMQEFETKKRRSEEKVRRLLMEKSRRLREESVKQALKCEAAKNVRDELNRRREEERTRQQRLSEREQSVRGERVKWAKEWKAKVVCEKNERKKQEHAVAYTKVKEEERERMNRARRRIQEKDIQAKVFKEKKEEATSRSRSSARMAAELRQKMRLMYDL